MNAMFGNMEADEANKFRASLAPDVIKSLVRPGRGSGLRNHPFDPTRGG
jgi:hypothetical protein